MQILTVAILLTICFSKSYSSSSNSSHVTNATRSTEFHPIVRTKLGPVRGNRYKIFNATVDIYWGIPYAKPPLNSLRFRNPEPALPWNGTRDGTKMPNACQQYFTSSTNNITTNITEDCLYLNVFAGNTSVLPPLNCSATNQSLPVMFFIHGGGFYRGSSAMEYYNGTELAAVLGGIVITINYRLGVFGFLYAGTEDAPGNAGLFDQLQALKWVHDNIACFGGDRDSITVFGGSAGGTSVGALMLTPLSANLFQKAILISGTPNIPNLFTTSKSSVETVLNMARLAGCNSSSVQDKLNFSIQCLKELPEKQLDALQEKHKPANYQPIMVAPFFPQRLDDLYQNAKDKNISVLIGVTENDGYFFLPYRHGNYIKMKENVTLNSQQLLLVLEKELNSGHKRFTPSQKLVAFHAYINWEDPHNGEENLKIAGNFLTDTMFICPTNAFGKNLVDSDDGLDVYVYMFAHRSSVSKWPSWAGTVHGDDLPFIFGHPFRSDGYTAAEKHLSLRIMKHFGQFARTGDPSLDDFQWPKYKKHSLSFTEMSLNSPKLRRSPRAKQCALWNVVLPKLADIGCETNETIV